MLTSLGIMLLFGLIFSEAAKRLRIPALVGMLFAGVLLGPHVLNIIDKTVLSISGELRQIALVIILTRAGLAMNLKDLKKVGRPALLMCFLPACFEITGYILMAPKLLHITVLEAAIMGAVMAAVSPAVIVPRMLKLTEEGYGTKKGVPQLIMAGASVDDIFVIVLFTSFTSLATGEQVSLLSFAGIPIAVISGVFIGIITGILLNKVFYIMHLRDSLKVIAMLSVSFILLWAEQKSILPFSALLAIMTVGGTLFQNNKEIAGRLSIKFSSLWAGAEILLFILVGTAIDINYAMKAGFSAIAMILIALVFRSVGVYVCFIKTELKRKEKMFCMISYIPKATVQAAIGTIPLAMGLNCGKIVLTVAVLAILLTAPLGAFFIDMTYKKLL
ncbi:potassium transporter [Anaerocolumna cellulosilytica]|uniref:Potassium transporter n=1 Tax=Anaerocolumna cellulosilytica TaxID=433286 RepID=A0A6S6RDW6_9FIRM|nr:cation:proton antiporter [Anaerocolumna cellulosilytica]MBB5195910.1 NhaP-type Na+/H+ or K+/H+ antiporter [Anaerocolumna cellulosilytica]BCJ96921.1 potassium transporter [Anaerocolumna cellulosilytica]